MSKDPFRTAEGRAFYRFLESKRKEFERASVIVGIDCHNEGHPAIFYGREEFKKAKTPKCLCIGYDNTTEELEILAAFVKVCKGRCEYLSAGEERQEELYERLAGGKWPRRWR
jgi:hypothetical protein